MSFVESTKRLSTAQLVEARSIVPDTRFVERIHPSVSANKMLADTTRRRPRHPAFRALKGCEFSLPQVVRMLSQDLSSTRYRLSPQPNYTIHDFQLPYFYLLNRPHQTIVNYAFPTRNPTRTPWLLPILQDPGQGKIY